MGLTHLHSPEINRQPYNEYSSNLDEILLRTRPSGTTVTRAPATRLPLPTHALVVNRAMRHPRQILPLELQTIVIDMVAEDLHVSGLVESSRLTLSTCTLVCRTWLNRCRKHLFKLVTLRRIRHLEALASTPSVHAYVIGVAAHEERYENPFVHLIPGTLGTRLRCLKSLSLGTYADELSTSPANHDNSQKRTFYYHTSFPLHLTQFRALRNFTLLNFRFASFLDLRRIVGALPNLSSVFMTKVTWEKQKSASFPLIRATKWGVSKVTMWDCQLDILGLWFWLHPPVRAPRCSYKGFEETQSHLALLVDDAVAIRIIIENLSVQTQQGQHRYMDFEWGYIPHKAHWELSCKAGGACIISSVFTIEGDKLPNNNYPSVASVKAVRFLLPLYVDWGQIAWKEIDSMLGRFPRLKEVVLVIPWLMGNSATPEWTIVNQLGLSWSVADRLATPDPYGDVSQAIQSHLPFTNRRCDLQIVYKAHQLDESKYTT